MHQNLQRRCCEQINEKILLWNLMQNLSLQNFNLYGIIINFNIDDNYIIYDFNKRAVKFQYVNAPKQSTIFRSIT